MKGLETLHRCSYLLRKDDLNIIEKELEALEILKEVGGISWERILKVWLKIEKIDNDKYELLKEVLL